MDIDGWRKKIDKLNIQILKLLNERARYAIEIGKIKKRNGEKVRCPEREAAILKKLTASNKGPLNNETVKKIFKKIIVENRKMEHCKS